MRQPRLVGATETSSAQDDTSRKTSVLRDAGLGSAETLYFTSLGYLLPVKSSTSFATPSRYVFIIALTKDGASITAEALLPQDAVNFVGDYLACAHPILSPWEQKEGRWTACVYDWEAAWWGDYVALARIIAPPTFAPRSNETLEHALSVNAHLQRLESKRVATNRT